jgi:hypothetical protein
MELLVLIEVDVLVEVEKLMLVEVLDIEVLNETLVEVELDMLELVED